MGKDIFLFIRTKWNASQIDILKSNFPFKFDAPSRGRTVRLNSKLTQEVVYIIHHFYLTPKSGRKTFEIHCHMIYNYDCVSKEPERLGLSKDKHEEIFILLSCVLLLHNTEITEISTDQQKQNQRCSTDGHRYSHMNGLIYEDKSLRWTLVDGSRACTSLQLTWFPRGSGLCPGGESCGS